MTRRADCLACSDARADEINALLEAGTSGRKVAREFGISQPTISRHKSRCLATPVAGMPDAASLMPLPAPAASDDPSATAESLRALQGIHGAALARYEAAQESGDGRLMAALLPELRRSLEAQLVLRERLDGSGSGPAPLSQHPDFASTRQRLAAFADRHPDLRDELAEVFRG